MPLLRWDPRNMGRRYPLPKRLAAADAGAMHDVGAGSAGTLIRLTSVWVNRSHILIMGIRHTIVVVIRHAHILIDEMLTGDTVGNVDVDKLSPLCCQSLPSMTYRW